MAHVRVIEFHKQGLPHAHCIFIRDQASKNLFEIRREYILLSQRSFHLKAKICCEKWFFSTGSETRADRTIKPQCAWETGVQEEIP